MRTILRHNEILYLISKKHWVVLANPVLFIVTYAAIVLMVYLAHKDIGNLLLYGFPIPIAFLIWKSLDRKYDLWVVTNHRVIDEWGVLTRNSKQSPLDKIHNISCKQSIMGRILGYGTVEIQTAAEMGSTVYRYVSKPNLLKELIMRGMERYRE